MERQLRFGIAGMTSDHVWSMGDGLASLPEVQLVAGDELYSTAEPRVPEDWLSLDLPTRTGGGRAPENLRAWRAPSAGANAGRGGREQRYFVDCLLRNRPIEGAASPRVARDVQEVIEAVYRSAETGRTVPLPLT